MRYCIVGGGILGLAVGRLITAERPGSDVVVFEKEAAVGRHQTGHNSGVIHAGLYYEPGSLKARLCRRGVGLLEAYCEGRGIRYESCGKIVVALEEDELGRLDAIHERAVANGVPEVRMLDAAELRKVEPHAAGIAALHSPRTSIVDYGAVAAAFAADIEDAGGEVQLHTSVTRVRDDVDGSVLELADGSSVAADAVVVCAGLQADRLAAASGQPTVPRIMPFRGEYWALRSERTSLVRGLIYPTPDPSLPFLGVHLTKRIDGGVLVGPNAVLATAREGYRRGDFSRHDMGEMMRARESRRLFAKYWRTGLSEMMRSGSKSLFVAQARRYVPVLRTADVVPAMAGVRAQAIDADGSMVDDFRLARHRQVSWVRNAPSPAATSSMAIAEELLERVEAAA